jgi:hypothetical protein
MKWLFAGIAASTMLSPVAYAQSNSSPTAVAAPRRESPGQYTVFFALGSAKLNSEARQVVARAAEDYRRSGQAQVTVTGHTDTSGSAEYNQRLSARRAEAVQGALVAEGVPATSIATVARGQDDLLVQTANGVREPENRRVEIVVPQPAPAPPPEPVAEAPPPAPTPPPPEQPGRFGFTLGPVYGHNFGESDKDNGDKTQNDLVGAELTFKAIPGFLGGVSLKQMALWSLNGIDDGLTGRSVASLDFAPDLGIFRPRLSANVGGVYGKGVQDGFVAGPELGFDLTPIAGFTVGLKAAYDYQFRNAGWDEGILWGGLDLGIRF